MTPSIATPDAANRLTLEQAIEIALADAKAGWAVLPIAVAIHAKNPNRLDKPPLVDNGKDDATKDPDLILEQFTAGWKRLKRGQVIGVGRVPASNGAVVFDLDQHDEGKDGVEYGLRQLGLPPHTQMVNTATGDGVHGYYAKRDKDTVVTNASPWATDGVDVRGDNGYVVAPGTRTPWGNWEVVAGKPTTLAKVPERIWDQLVGAAQKAEQAKSDEVAGEPIDGLTLPGDLMEMIDDLGPWIMNDEKAEFGLARTTDRSRRFMSLVRKSRDSGLTQGQTVTLLTPWCETIGKYDGRVAAEVARCWGKLGDAPSTIVVVLEASHDPAGDGIGAEGWDPLKLHDIALAAVVAKFYLQPDHLAWGRAGWARWTGTHWDTDHPNDRIARTLHDALRHIHKQGVTATRALFDKESAGASDDELKEATGRQNARMTVLRRLLSAAKADMLMKHVRGYISVRLEDFDGPDTADLLNVGNGVVDLRTGTLTPHHRRLMFTKVTAVHYRPGAVHKDWAQALTALGRDEAEWLQLRIGQGATGHMPEDDLVVIVQGGGENGKTTLLHTSKVVLGDFAITVPDKVLVSGNYSEHDAMYMPFKGARLAVIEELPGDKWLPDEKLKKLAGSEAMTAHRMREDWVSWPPTHSLLVSTNHDVRVAETDHGTWRRLAKLVFPFTFDGSNPDHPRDDGLRARLRHGEDGRHEAALAWVVAGAVRSYATTLNLEGQPASVRAATAAWRASGNTISRFLEEHLEYSPNSAVLSADVYRIFVAWAQATGSGRMSDQLFWERAAQTELFESPGVEKRIVRATDISVSPAWRTVDRGRMVTALALTTAGEELLQSLELKAWP